MSGYWHTQGTLGRFCRIRSYLTPARNHSVDAMSAIHTPSPEIPGSPPRPDMIIRGHLLNGHHRPDRSLWCIQACRRTFGVAFWHALGLPFLAARPFCVYGPGDNPAAALTEVNRYLRWHLNHRPIQIVGDKVRKTRDFVHVSDLVAGLLVIADKAETGEIFNIGSGTETSMERLVQSIEKATGRAAEVTEITEIQEDTYRLVGDISNISRLGYVPRVSLDDGVAQLAAELGPHPELPSVDTIFNLARVQSNSRQASCATGPLWGEVSGQQIPAARRHRWARASHG